MSRKNRIKVAIVLMHFNYGGAERMVSLLASHLDLSRFDVKVICVFGNPHENILEQAILMHGVPIYFIRKGLGFSIRHLIRLWRILSAFKPNVVHTHLNACMYCAPWVLCHKVRMLHTIHNIPDKEAKNRLRRFVMSTLYKSGKAIPVAISDINRNLTATFYRIPKKQVAMVVNPVDIAAFADSCPKSFSRRKYDFIHIARFEEAKNHKGLVSAFSKVVLEEGYSSAKLVLVGAGPLLEIIEAQVKALGMEDNVLLLGIRDDIPDLMHSAKCLLLPSLYEGLPMSVLEAMASGLPIIASRVGGIPELVNGNGVLVEPGSVDDLKRAMVFVLKDPLRWSAMSERSFQLVQKYDICAVTTAYENEYMKAIDY